MPDALVKPIKIFISSTNRDLKQYRDEASRIIKEVGEENEDKVHLVEISQDKETPTGDREFPLAISKKWVEDADWVVVIVGFNYGTISEEDGPCHRSITECEYQHARDQKKQLFVFMAGDPADPNCNIKYRALLPEEEPEDLKDWKEKQTDEQREKLKNFREQLAKEFLVIFDGLKTFRVRLKTTLKKSINRLSILRESPPLPPGSPLADLIVALSPQILDCIQRVQLISHCKMIHDHLHEIRQHVMRPLREEVLLPWRQNGMLYVEKQDVTIQRAIKHAEKAAGLINLVADKSGFLDPNRHRTLCDLLDIVIDSPYLWDDDWALTDSQKDLDRFAKRLNDFAQEVQNAFTEADEGMRAEEKELRDGYNDLLGDLEKARLQLGQADNKSIDDFLVNIRANKQRVQSSLDLHHDWQKIHDKLHILDSLRETPQVFDQWLAQFCKDMLKPTLLLVTEQLQKNEAFMTGNSGSLQGKCVWVHKSRSRPDCHLACSPCLDKLKVLKKCLEELRDKGGSDAFDAMRIPFDDAFYCVDKRTLEEVHSARKRASNLEEWLKDLTDRVCRMKVKSRCVGGPHE